MVWSRRRLLQKRTPPRESQLIGFCLTGISSEITLIICYFLVLSFWDFDAWSKKDKAVITTPWEYLPKVEKTDIRTNSVRKCNIVTSIERLIWLSFRYIFFQFKAIISAGSITLDRYMQARYQNQLSIITVYEFLRKPFSK